MASNSILDNPTRWERLGEPDGELEQMLKDGAKPRFTGTHDASKIHEMRKRWHPLFKAGADDVLRETGGEVIETEIFIPTRDGYQLRGLLYRSRKTPVSGAPLVLLFHGGGFCAGNAEAEAPGCIASAQAHGCVSISLEYRMAPEIKFPTPWDDCWDALVWICANASKLGADLSLGFVIGGTSAGGHLAIPLVHKARDEKLSPPVTGVYLNASPALAPQAVTEEYKALYRSRETLSSGLSLTAESISLYDRVMEPEFSSPYWSPLLWPTGHANLPPHFFQVCGADMLRDEALIYARQLKQNGVPTEVVVYQGMPHVFWYDYPSHPRSKQFARDTTAGIGQLLASSRRRNVCT